MHVYLSVGQQTPSGELVNPKTGVPTRVMRYRGEVDSDDNGEAFARLMQRNRHIVIFSEVLLGKVVPPKGHREFSIDDYQKDPASVVAKDVG